MRKQRAGREATVLAVNACPTKAPLGALTYRHRFQVGSGPTQESCSTYMYKWYFRII